MTHTTPLSFLRSPSIHYNTPKEGGEVDPTPGVVKVAEISPEMEARIEKRLREKWDADQARKAEKEKTDREAEEARKRGEWEKLANDEQTKREIAEQEREALKLDLKGKDVDLRLRDHLAEKHPDYIAVAKYIRPLIEFDAETNDADLDKRIATAAEQYTKDNPRAAARTGTPNAPVQKIPRGTDVPSRTNDDRQPSRRPFAHLNTY